MIRLIKIKYNKLFLQFNIAFIKNTSDKDSYVAGSCNNSQERLTGSPGITYLDFRHLCFRKIAQYYFR